jgi:8-amino-7-oxononanoate synthase
VRVHCSPPSTAVVRAAEHALAVNRDRGEALRARLARLVARFACGLDAMGARGSRSLFPVQPLAGVAGREARQLHARLLASGIRTVVHGDDGDRTARLSFLLTAEHRAHDVDAALQALRAALVPTRPALSTS